MSECLFLLIDFLQYWVSCYTLKSAYVFSKKPNDDAKSLSYCRKKEEISVRYFLLPVVLEIVVVVTLDFAVVERSKDNARF